MSQNVSVTQRAWDSFQFFLCLGVLCMLLVYLLTWYGRSEQAHEEQAVAAQRDVSVTGHKNMLPSLINRAIDNEWVVIPELQQRGVTGLFKKQHLE